MYQEGSNVSGGDDPVPTWLLGECVYADFCQCNLVSRRHQGWHHPGAMCSNIVSRRHQLFEGQCGYSHIQRPFPSGCDRNTKNVEVATRLSRVVVHVLSDVPPSVPQRGAPLVSVLASRQHTPKCESRRFERIRLLRRLRMRRTLREEDSEDGDEESSEEESLA